MKEKKVIDEVLNLVPSLHVNNLFRMNHDTMTSEPVYL